MVGTPPYREGRGKEGRSAGRLGLPAARQSSCAANVGCRARLWRVPTIS